MRSRTQAGRPLSRSQRDQRALFAAVIAIRNWFALAITMGLALLAIFFFINFATAVLNPILANSTEHIAHFQIRPDRYGVWQFILIVLAFWPASCAWAYWFTSSGRVRLRRFARLFSTQSLVALLIFVLALMWPAKQRGWHEVLKDSILVISALSFLIYALAQFVSYRRDRLAGATRQAKNRVEALAEEDRVRNRLSRWLLLGTMVFLATAALAAFHWASREQFRKDPRILREVDPTVLSIAAAVTAIPSSPPDPSPTSSAAGSASIGSKPCSRHAPGRSSRWWPASPCSPPS